MEQDKSVEHLKSAPVIEEIRLAKQLERRVAIARVKIGDVTIDGVAVWRGANGHLSVYWPRYWNGFGQSEAISLPPELRADVEADVISAYKAKKADDSKPGGGAQRKATHFSRGEKPYELC